MKKKPQPFTLDIQLVILQAANSYNTEKIYQHIIQKRYTNKGTQELVLEEEFGRSTATTFRGVRLLLLPQSRQEKL